jgi:hypothetical protein
MDEKTGENACDAVVKKLQQQQQQQRRRRPQRI